MGTPNDNEHWRDVAGYEGRYMVSDQGRVMSIKTKRFRTPEGVVERKVKYILKPIKDSYSPKHAHKTANKNGNYYRVVNLCKHRNVKRFHIHSLVCLAFIGERPYGYDIDHIDGNRSNNKLSNLRYCTHSQNMVYSLNDGRMCSVKVKAVAQLEIPFTIYYPSVRQLRRDLNIRCHDVLDGKILEAHGIKYKIIYIRNEG